MDGRVLGIVIVGIGIVVAGCRSVSPPSVAQPGPVAVQRARAQQFDPFPETDIAPDIAGARPRGVQEPPPETVRARWFPWNWGQR